MHGTILWRHRIPESATESTGITFSYSKYVLNLSEPSMIAQINFFRFNIASIEIIP